MIIILVLIIIILYNKNNEYNPFTERNHKKKAKGMTLTPNRLRQAKTTQVFDKSFNNNKYRSQNINYNNDNASFHSKETQKYNNDYYNNDYSEQQSNPYNNDLNTNSTFSNYSEAKDRNFQKYIKYKEKLGIPIVPRENLKKFVNSRIIFTKNELRLLKTLLKVQKIYMLFLIYYIEHQLMVIMKKSLNLYQEIKKRL